MDEWKCTWMGELEVDWMFLRPWLEVLMQSFVDAQPYGALYTMQVLIHKQLHKGVVVHNISMHSQMGKGRCSLYTM